MSEDKNAGRIPGEDKRDESTAMICGYDYPASRPVGRCFRCGGEVWPIEDECWDGAQFHYITFAYRCGGCGLQEMWDFSIKD